MSIHSNLSPSAAERWTACPGSVALCATLPPQKTSEYAAEGTAAHSLCEKLLKKEITKAQLLAMEGETIVVEDFEIEVTDEMIDAVILYHDTVMCDLAEACVGDNSGGEPLLKMEHRGVAKSIDEHVYGTTDTLLCARGGMVLKVYDFKYGKGLAVNVVGNKQMLIYAIAAALDYLPNPLRKEVELVIIQPRARHEDGEIRRWTVSVEELKKYAAELKTAAAATRAPKAEFKAGDHCRWCGGKALCPVMFNAVQKEAQVDFSVVSSPAAVGSLRDVKTMGVREMAMALEWDDAISSWFDAIRERAKELLSSGQEFPGWKLVDGKSNRKWIEEDAVVKEFGALFEVYEKKLLSPAKLEKIVGKGKLDSFTFKPEASKTLARDSDPRPATKSSAAEDFGVARIEDKGAVDELDGLM